MSSFLRRKSKESLSRKSSKGDMRRTSTGKMFSIQKSLSGKLTIAKQTGKPMTLAADEHVSFEQSVAPTVLESLDQKERKRQQVIFEMIQTERAFLRDLMTLKNLFRREIEEAKALTPEQIRKIFSNLDEVIATSTQLYEQLVHRRLEGLVGRIADIFVSMFESGAFDPYVTFCANQLPASEYYGRMIRESPEFVKVMAKCDQSTELTKGFDLPAFLLKGMQRLLKYHPLLQQIMKRTNEHATADLAELHRAMELVEAHGKIVNEAVRESENTRRLPVIKAMLVRESTSIKWVKPQFNLDITADPERRLVHEGRLKFIRPQSAIVPGSELKTLDMYVILLSDMILLTTEREGKFVVKEGKDPIPVIHISAITGITTEITEGLEGRKRTTLCFEVAEREVEYDSSLVSTLDGPRPVHPSSKKMFLRFIAPAQGQLQTWMGYLRKTRKDLTEKAHELVRTASQTESIGTDEYAVTMLVSRVESVRAPPEPDAATAITPDWEISWSTAPVGATGLAVKREEMTTLTTRSVRLVQGPVGLGFTLIGRNPVEFQEVDIGGPAHQSGVRQGDQIRAVDGIECTNSAHHEVVGLIRDAMAHPKKALWVPVTAPIEEITELDAQSLNSLGRSTRSMRKALLTDPAELELQGI